MKKIKKISIVCQTGAETYQVGRRGIVKIEMLNKSYMGDPLDMYCCIDQDGFNVAEISPLCPIVIEYE